MAHRIVSKLAVAAALAASIPAAALAHDGDWDRDVRPAPVTAPAPIGIPERHPVPQVIFPPARPAPVVAPVPACPPPPAPGWQRHDDRRAEGWRREALRRDLERHAIQDQLRALDAERFAFHARVHNPWRLSRYDRSYAERRSELEQRLAQLDHRYAWR